MTCQKQELLTDTKDIPKWKLEHQLKKEVPSARLYEEKADYTWLTKRILDLNKDKDKLWQE